MANGKTKKKVTKVTVDLGEKLYQEVLSISGVEERSMASQVKLYVRKALENAKG